MVWPKITYGPALPLLLGHRGACASKSVPENTPASFDLALTHGCDGFEFDVRLTADKQAVVCHDPQHGPHAIARSPSSGSRICPGLTKSCAAMGSACFSISN